MIPINNLLGVNSDLILQNDEGSTLGSSTAVFVSSWANKQFQKAGEAASSPGSFVGIIHYTSTNIQGDLIAATVSDGDWAKITTQGKTWHNYQRRVETTWNEGDTLYLAMGVAQDGLLTNSPGASTEIIEVGKCLTNAGSNEDALIELSSWRSSLRVKDAGDDSDAVIISIIGGVGGTAVSSGGGDGSNIKFVAGAGGVGTSSYDGGNGGIFSIYSGAGGDSSSGDAGSGGDSSIIIGNGGDADTGGSPGQGGSFVITIGDGGDGVDSSGATGGSYTVNIGDGGDSSSSGDGGNGGDITYNIGTGGAATVGTGGIGGGFSITSGAGGVSSSGTGGSSGDISLTISNGGNGTTAGGDSGALSIGGGAGGVGATGGAGGALTIISGAGGVNSIDTAPRIGGTSGAVIFKSGQGGNNTAASGGTGGDSGSVLIESGGAGSSTYGTAGDAGLISIKAGKGGASTSGNAGIGGTAYLTGGQGGSHATASNSYIPGAAGAVIIAGGQGGLGSTTQIGADGADVTITGGDGGDDRGAGDGDGGDVVIDGGVGDTNGVVSIGETNASAINSGSSTVWTHSGNINATNFVASGKITISSSSDFTYDASKTIVKHINLAQGQTALSGAWDFLSSFRWESVGTSEEVFFPLGIPFTGASGTITIEVMVQPGAARSTQSERMRMELAYAEPNWSTPAIPSFSSMGSFIYDDGTTDVQILTHSTSWQPVSNRMYRLELRSGTTAGTDYIYAIRVTCSSAVLTHGLIDI